MTAREVVNARKTRFGPEDLSDILSDVNEVVACKRGKVTRIDLTDDPEKETLESHLLGRTNKLRAPTLKVGTTLLVGYDEEAYKKLF